MIALLGLAGCGGNQRVRGVADDEYQDYRTKGGEQGKLFGDQGLSFGVGKGAAKADETGGGALGVNAVNLVSLMLRLHPTDSQVPVHFSSFTLFDRLGPWYYPFEVAVVSLMITIINVVFAYHSFTRSRLASFFLLVTAVVVSVFGFIIAQAFGAVR